MGRVYNTVEPASFPTLEETLVTLYGALLRSTKCEGKDVLHEPPSGRAVVRTVEAWSSGVAC